VTASRRQLDLEVGEADYQATIVDLARLHGWWVYHPYDSRHSAAGWPDLTLLRPPQMVCLEVKAEAGRVTPEQAAVLGMLRRVPGVVAEVVRPSDWPKVVKLLARPASRPGATGFHAGD
jgi:VRR-NUC domain